jgi:hypothetical protein
VAVGKLFLVGTVWESDGRSRRITDRLTMLIQGIQVVQGLYRPFAQFLDFIGCQALTGPMQFALRHEPTFR